MSGDARVRRRGVVALAALLGFYVIGGLHRVAPDLVSIVQLWGH